MGDFEAMTGDYVNLELAEKRGNPSVIWRSGQVMVNGWIKALN
jgi:hypothetical protein